MGLLVSVATRLRRIAAARGSCYRRVLLLSVAMSVEKKGVDYMGGGSRERGLSFWLKMEGGSGEEEKPWGWSWRG